MTVTNEWLGINHSNLTKLNHHHQLHESVAPAFNALQAAAQAAGIDCQLVSSYRSFERQLSIWNRKWAGELPLYDAQGKQLNQAKLSDNEKLEAILTWSALPGGSRHHWGTDFDVYDKQSVTRRNWQFELVTEEYEPSGPCFELACWLGNQAERFGFYRPYEVYTGGVAREPWHLSHRSTALQFEKARNCQALSELLEKTEISGKHAILSRIDELFERYVLNRGDV